MADPVVIEQIDGQRRRLELQGANLPNDGVEIPLRRRVEVKHLPESDEPEIHDLGNEWPEVTLSGEWDEYLNRQDETVADLHDTAARILREGRRVRITWGDRWDYVGMLMEYAPGWREGSLLTWRIRVQLLADDRPEEVAERRERRAVRSSMDGVVAALIAKAAAARTRQLTIAAAANVAAVLP